MRNKKCVLILGLVILMGLLCSECMAAKDNTIEFIKNSERYYKKGQYQKSLEELEWAKREIETKIAEKLKTLLPQSVPGYVRNISQSSGMLGLMSASATYLPQQKGGSQINLTMASQGASVISKGLDALLNLAQMASSLGMEAATTVVVQGKRGTLLTTPNGESTLVFGLDNKVIVTLKSTGPKASEDITAFAEQIDFKKIEESI